MKAFFTRVFISMEFIPFGIFKMPFSEYNP